MATLEKLIKSLENLKLLQLSPQFTDESSASHYIWWVRVPLTPIGDPFQPGLPLRWVPEYEPGMKSANQNTRALFVPRAVCDPP
uniref:Uncharacterized protein n=1 Tax=Timema genevievae TaxID=629358 RepID=A0A7R9JW68_TIMGE|nr:unnamed protein product [Timema genevievae]